MAKIQDIVAATGEYTNREGVVKKLHHRVGKLITKDDGQVSIKLSAWFNPSALKQDDQGEVWLNVYDQKPREGAGHAQAVSSSAKTIPDNFDDDIAF